MFTGLVTTTGILRRQQPLGGDIRLWLQPADWDLASLKMGESIAINGACLTLVECAAREMAFDVSQETLQRTTLGQVKPGGMVNLERALRAHDRLGGHFVTGHVDGLARCTKMVPDARSLRVVFTAPVELAGMIAAKGSVCLDGVSLTVNSVAQCTFDVNLIPHTVQHTTLKQLRVGQQVNLEVDLIARYLARLVETRGPSGGSVEQH